MNKFVCAAVIFTSILTFGSCGLSKEDSLKEGTFYSLEEAFENGYMTREDIMHVCYYKNGKVSKETTETGGWEEVAFTPQKELTTLDEEVVSDIKENFYTQNKRLFQNLEGDEIGGVEDLSVTFWGEYNGCYTIEINSELWDYQTNILTISVDGIVWLQGYPLIKVFRYN